MIGFKFLAVTAMMGATLGIMMTRSDTDHVPAHAPLQSMPGTLGSWTARDVPLDPEVLHVLGDGSFLNRVYDESASAGTSGAPSGPVGLFIGYFPTQRTGQSIHSPQNCMPGSGWQFLWGHPMTLVDGTGKKYNVGEYLISNGTIQQEVLYWYQSQGRSVSNEYRAKFYMIEDAIRHNRTDAALVRVITPVQPGETQQQAHNRAVEFTKLLTPSLSTYIPN